MKILFVWPNKDEFGFKPIGISFLSALLKTKGHQIKLFDTTSFDFGYTENTVSGETAKIFKPVNLSSYNLTKTKVDLRKEIMKVLETFEPDLIALSVLSDEESIALEIAKYSKEWNKKIPTIIGGVYPTVSPERAISSPYIDFACIGEGLISLPEFVDRLEKNESPEKTKNIYYKRESQIIKNEIAPLYKELDQLPHLDWEIFDKRHFVKCFDGKVYVGGDHMIAWGCVNDCSYCINHFYHKMYGLTGIRRYSSKRIVKELKELVKKYNIEFFKFHDEDFLLKPKDYLEELAELYQNKVNIPFAAMVNPKMVTQERIELLKKMNCASVSLGIETGDCYLRKNILNRKDNEEHVIQAFKLLKQAKIRTSSFNMLAIPFETKETFMKTVELNKKADVQYPNMVYFFPFEGTILREIAIKNGFYDPKREKVYQRDKPTLSYKNLSSEELIQLRNNFVFYVKLPKIFWKFIDRARVNDEIGKKIKRELTVIYEKYIFANDGWFKDDGNVQFYLNKLEKKYGIHFKDGDIYE